MGNKPSSPNVQSTLTQANFHPEVEVLEKSHHDPHYGEVKVVRDVKNASKYVLKEITHHTNKSFDADHAFFSKRVTVKHPNVIDIIGFNTLSQSNLCANHFKITLFIEHVDRNLKADLDVRRTSNQAYSDNEILSIADDVISGLSYFQQQNISHGDIRPLNIFVKNGTCKLSDPSLNAERGFGSLVKSIISGTKTLPSPLVLTQIASHKFEPAGNPFKNDVFSLGATLLSLATLTNSEDFYDYKKGKLDEVLIEQRLQIVQRNRPSSILELIRDMLTLNELKRPDPLALLQRIQALRGGARPLTTAPVSYMPSEVKRSAVITSPTIVSAPPVYTSAPGSTTAVGDDLEARIKAALERSQATFRAVNANTTTTTSVPTTTTTTVQPTVDTTIQSSNFITAQPNVLRATSPTVQLGSTYVPSGQYSYTLPANTTVEGLRRSGVTTYQGAGVATSTYPGTTTYTTIGGEGLKRSGVTTYQGAGVATSTYPGTTTYTTIGGEGLKRSGVTTYQGTGVTTYPATTAYSGVELRKSGGLGYTTGTAGYVPSTQYVTSGQYIPANQGNVQYVPYTGELRKSGVTTYGQTTGLTTTGLTTGVTTGLPTTGLTTDANTRRSSDANNAGYTSGGYSTYASQNAIDNVVNTATGSANNIAQLAHNATA